MTPSTIFTGQILRYPNFAMKTYQNKQSQTRDTYSNLLHKKIFLPNRYFCEFELMRVYYIKAISLCWNAYEAVL